MSKTTISDTRIRIRPSKKLLETIVNNIEDYPDVPQNIIDILEINGYKTPKDIKICSERTLNKPKINQKLLKEITNGYTEIVKKDEQNIESVSEKDLAESQSFFYLNDLKWLNKFLIKLRQEKRQDIFLHSLIESSSLLLPENEVIERNPELEARCQKLREQQQNLEYFKMTKNVDSVMKYYPEDTIAFQLKAINSQMIAVLQFVVSVIAGFAFGFLGVQWMVGSLDFGFRLLLGVMCALVIALAEMYFLAKKLVEYDTAVDNKVINSGPKKNQKIHND